jgi:hypothetical protein
MTFPNPSRVDRMILVGTLAVIALAIMFPVKETFVWQETRWERLELEMFTIEEYSEKPTTVFRFPWPPVGPVGRGFILSERQRKMSFTGGKPESGFDLYFKEQFSLQRMAFEVAFVALLGAGLSYALRGAGRSMK